MRHFWAALVLGGCAMDAPAILTPEIGEGSILLVTLRLDDIKVSAVQVAGEPAFAAFPPLEGIHYALFYPTPLADLGLSPGAVPVALSFEESFPLPAPSRLHRQSAEGRSDRVEDWIEVDADPLPAPLRELRIRGRSPTPCRDLTPDTVWIPGTMDDHPQWILPAGERVLVGTELGLFYEIDAAGLVEPRPDIIVPEPIVAAAFDDQARLLLFGQTGGVFRGPDFAQTATLAPGVRRWMNVDAGGDPRRIYSVSFSGAAERLDPDGSVTVLAKNDGIVDGAPGQIVYLDDDEQILVGLFDNSITTLTPAGVEHATILSDTERPRALIDHPVLGPTIGTEVGGLLVREGSEWVRQDVGVAGFPIKAMAALDDGLLYGGGLGVLSQWYPGFGTCEPMAYSGDDVERLLPFGDGFVGQVRNNGTRDLQYLFLTP